MQNKNKSHLKQREDFKNCHREKKSGLIQSVGNWNDINSQEQQWEVQDSRVMQRQL
jgi:hypothetical protein